MKINIRKSLLACMASMTLISFTAYGSEQSDQDQILREIAERIAASGDILDKIQEGAPWEDVQKLVEDLKLRAGWSASTSKTMAARMTEKGLLRYEGKPRRYYPNVTREEAGFEETEQLLSRAFGGRLGLLVSNFADHGKIGKDELDELYAILDKAAGRGE